MRTLKKARRELDRLKVRLRALAEYPFEPFLQRRHDGQFKARAVFEDGLRPLTGKVAIFLIYQPRGLSKSVIETCKELDRAGYSVLLMSNSELSDDSRLLLRPFTWQIVQRPNFGYDFGGYRDGVNLIRKNAGDLQSLILLNDSIWWPLLPGDTILQRMEAAGRDVVGTILHHPAPRLLERRRPFLESYFYWFGPRVLTSAVFWDFWDSYRVSSLKYNAIRRGERRLTGVLLDAGLTATGLFTSSALLERLRSTGAGELEAALNYAAFIDTIFVDQAARLSAQTARDALWCEEVLAFMERVVAKRIFHPTFPCSSIRHLGANYLKKTPSETDMQVHFLMRDQVLRAVRSGYLPELLPVIKLEVEQRQSTGAAAVGR